MPPAIVARDLRKSYGGVEALRGISFEVAEGEVFGLLGPNGAGKTTTVEICEGLLEPDAGEVTVLGRSWRGNGGQELRQRIGVSLQESKFHDKQTAREILRLFRSFYEKGREVEEVIALVSLGEKADTYTEHLSGGQHQRLAVACALVGDPELLFLDEPTTGLDPQSRRQLWDVVRDFRARGGTVLLTTHYMEEAEQLCDTIAIVDHGRRIALGTPKALVASLGAAHVVEMTAPGLGGVLRAEDAQTLPSVRECKITGDQVQLHVESPHLAVPALGSLLIAKGLELDGLATRHASLDDVFLKLTGRQLREDEA